MFKTRTKADLIRGLASNEGLAEQLAIYQTRYGDWRELFRYLDRVDKVTKADIRRVANQVFQDNNRTVGIIETQTASSQPGPGSPPAKERNSNERAQHERYIDSSAVILSGAQRAYRPALLRDGGARGSPFRHPWRTAMHVNCHHERL